VFGNQDPEAPYLLDRHGASGPRNDWGDGHSVRDTSNKRFIFSRASPEAFGPFTLKPDRSGGLWECSWPLDLCAWEDLSIFVTQGNKGYLDEPFLLAGKKSIDWGLLHDLVVQHDQEPESTEKRMHDGQDGGELLPNHSLLYIGRGLRRSTPALEKLVPLVAKVINNELKTLKNAAQLVISLASRTKEEVLAPRSHREEGAVPRKRGQGREWGALMTHGMDSLPGYGKGKEFKINTEEVGFLDGVMKLRDFRLGRLLDSVEYDKAQRNRVDTAKFKLFYHLNDYSDATHARMAKAAKAARLKPSRLGTPLVELQDSLGRDWVLVHLDSKAAYKEESNRMAHCIGEGSYYWNQAQAGDMKAFSLRLVENGLPYVTVNLEAEFDDGMGGRSRTDWTGSGEVFWSVEQAKLYADAVVGDSEAPYDDDGGDPLDIVQRVYPMQSPLREINLHPAVEKYSRLMCALLEEALGFLGVSDWNSAGDLSWCYMDDRGLT